MQKTLKLSTTPAIFLTAMSWSSVTGGYHYSHERWYCYLLLVNVKQRKHPTAVGAVLPAFGSVRIILKVLVINLSKKIS